MSRDELVEQHIEAAREVYQAALSKARERYPIASEVLVREVALKITRTALDLAHAGDAYRTK